MTSGRVIALVALVALVAALACCRGRVDDRPAGGRASPLVHELMAKPPPLLEAIAKGRPLRLVDDAQGYRRVSTPLFASLDESPGWLGLDDEARRSTGLSGSGVVVGIVDTGIDWTHADFLGEDGTSRILYILDLMLPAVYPDPHPEVDHGIYRIYGKREIDDALDHLRRGEDPPVPVESTDLIGHGTHVASIAAGRDPAGLYDGMAPGAWIVVVKAIRAEGTRFEDVDVILAADFIFSVCDMLGAPCVVNLSLGGQMGGHDGSSLVEQSIAGRLAEKPQGRAVVAAAGNHGGAALHARMDLRGGDPETVTLRVPDNAPPVDGGVSRIVLDGWIRGGEAVVSLAAPSGARIGAAPGELVQDVIDGSWLCISHSPSGPDPFNGDREMIVTLTGSGHAGGEIGAGAYALELEGEGAVDIWLAQADLATGLFGTVYLDGEDVAAGGTVDIPATARDVIAAGAMTVRTSWRTADGALIEAGGAGPGEPSLFSSAGPSRDGAIKPDFLAPGEWIAAAFSASVDAGNPDAVIHGMTLENMLTADGTHVYSRGTSSAAPHLAGLVALLFEADPGMTFEEARAALLFSGSGAPAGDGEAPLDETGFAAPDFTGAADIAAGRLGGEIDLDASLVLASAVIYAPRFSPPVEILVLPLDGIGAPATGADGIEIIPTDCAMEAEPRLIEPGLVAQAWSCDEDEAPPPGRTVWFAAETGGRRLAHAASVLISDERTPSGSHLTPSGGGCSGWGQTM